MKSYFLTEARFFSHFLPDSEHIDASFSESFSFSSFSRLFPNTLQNSLQVLGNNRFCFLIETLKHYPICMKSRKTLCNHIPNKANISETFLTSILYHFRAKKKGWPPYYCSWLMKSRNWKKGWPHKWWKIFPSFEKWILMLESHKMTISSSIIKNSVKIGWCIPIL